MPDPAGLTEAARKWGWDAERWRRATDPAIFTKDAKAQADRGLLITTWRMMCQAASFDEPISYRGDATTVV